MKNIALPKRFTLNPSDYIRLNNGELGRKVKEISSVKLDRPVSIEDIEIELTEFASLKQPAQLWVYYFSHGCEFSEPVQISSHNRLLIPSNNLIERSWEDRKDVVMVTIVGFATKTQVIDLTAVPKVNELSEGDGFLAL